MAKGKHYYMIAMWHPQRGSTEENPAYAHGTGCYILNFPLENVRTDLWYTSIKRAQRVADKNITFNTRCKVIEVPAGALTKMM